MSSYGVDQCPLFDDAMDRARVIYGVYRDFFIGYSVQAKWDENGLVKWVPYLHTDRNNGIDASNENEIRNYCYKRGMIKRHVNVEQYLKSLKK